MMNNLDIIKLFKSYKPSEIVKSFLTSFIFFAILTAVALIPAIKAVYVYIPFVEYFLVLIFIYVSLIGIYAVHIFITTLKTYNDTIDLAFDKIKTQLATSISIIAFIAVIITFIILN